MATALTNYEPGYRLINGSKLNDMVGIVNNLQGTGTPGPVTATTLNGNTVTTGTGTISPTYSGTFTLNGVTPVTVANTNVTANSQVLVTLKTVGGTVGTSAPNVRTITAGTGFTIAGIASDTSIYNYAILG